MPHRPSFPGARALVGLVLACLASCQSLTANPETEPWLITHQGKAGISARMGVGSLYEVDSVVEIQDANNDGVFGLHGVMEPVGGVGLAGEYFIIDDLALFAGAEARIFEPNLGDDLISFGQLTQYELFFGTRWFLPLRYLETERLRPFLHAKVAYIPAVDFDMTLTMVFPDLNDAVLVSPYRGSEYWSMGLGGGLAYQLSDNLYAELSFFYEWPLTNSSAEDVPTIVTQGTGNPFVDDILSLLKFDIEIEPSGWIGFFSLTYVF